MISKKKKLGLLLIIGFIFLLSLNFSFISSNNHNYITDNPKISGIYYNIEIDDSATGPGANNWTWARTQPWCTTGDGTQENPYVIEDSTFLPSGLSDCFSVANSSKYFVVENCTFKDTPVNGYSGIRLKNVINAFIIDNQVYNNSHGIYCVNMNNSRIIDNNCSDNAFHGIHLSTNCDNNTIMGNNVINNENYGIYLFEGENNTIINCTIKDSSTGIMVEDSSDFRILNCTLTYLKGLNGQFVGFDLPGENGGGAYGIRLVSCINGLIISNYINEVTGGDGGDGGLGFIVKGGRGGDGGSCAALYCSNSRNLIIQRNTILNIYGGDGGRGGDDGMGIVDGGDGGDGGLAVGLHYYNSSNLECNENWISSIYGGAAGAGGDMMGGIVEGGDGGDGGFAIGLYYLNSSNSVSSHSLISNIYGGAAGAGGIGIPMGNNGVDGIAIGIYLNTNCTNNNIIGNAINTQADYGILLENNCDYNTLSENIIYENDYGIAISSDCNNNLVFYNCIFNNTVSNAEDDGQTYWDNGIFGNYWGDYSGIDADYDGIGDTPYNVPGGGGNKDNRPLMNYNPFFFIRPADSTHEVGTMGLNIEWIVINIVPVTLTFNVFRDGTSIKTGDLYLYINEIVIDVDCSDVGIYGFTIEVSDGSGGTYTDSVWITIINTAPVLTASPIDFSYEVGGVGNNLSWMFSDISTDNPTYTISRNGVPIFIDIPCVSGVLIEISIDGLEVGSYGFTIEINDGYGGTILDSVWITVTNTPPVFTSTPTDFSYDIGSTGNSLTWIFSDISTDYPIYTISRNSVPIIIANSCASGVPIEISIDGLEVGTYGFTIEINDGYAGIVLDTVWVTVERIAATESPVGTIIIALASFAGGIGVAGGILFLLRRIKGVREVTE